MTCPGGCIGGGGQPRYTNNQVRQARIDAIYREDEGKTLRKSHENPDVMRLYAEFLGQPWAKSRIICCTRSTRRAHGCRGDCSRPCVRECPIRTPDGCHRTFLAVSTPSFQEGDIPVCRACLFRSGARRQQVVQWGRHSCLPCLSVFQRQTRMLACCADRSSNNNAPLLLGEGAGGEGGVPVKKSRVILERPLTDKARSLNCRYSAAQAALMLVAFTENVALSETARKEALPT